MTRQSWISASAEQHAELRLKWWSRRVVMINAGRYYGGQVGALRRIKREQPAGRRHVFVSERGAPLTTNGFFKMLSRTAISIGMPDVHPHLLQHGTASSWSTTVSIPAQSPPTSATRT